MATAETASVGSTASSNTPRENRPSKRTLSESEATEDAKEMKSETEPVAKKTKVDSTAAATPSSSSSASTSTSTSTASSTAGTSSRRILFVTGNAGKLREVREVLGEELGSHVHNEKIDLLEIQGSAYEILTAKLREAAACVAKKVESERFDGILVEDTNLCLEAFGGLPGPYIKSFLKRAKREGLIRMANASEDRTAIAKCLFGFIDCTMMTEDIQSIHKRKIVEFIGECKGKIADAIKGESGFGWDPVFIPDDGDGRSFGEMTAEEKNKISHRAKALEKLKPFIEQFIKSAPLPPSAAAAAVSVCAAGGKVNVNTKETLAADASAGSTTTTADVTTNNPNA